MDPTQPYTTYESIRGAKIYMWDADWGEDEFLGSTVTDNSGYFYFGPISNDDWLDDPDIFFTFYAANKAAILCDTIQDGTRYMAWSDTLDDVPPGYHTYYDDLTFSKSKAFFVADVILDGYEEWKELRTNPADYPWDTLMVQLNKGSGNAYYSKSDDFIYLNDSVDAYHRWPNTWNKSTILHEYGHRLANMLGFFRQGGAQHTVYSLTDIGTASSEGWAQFWSAFVLESPVKVKYWNYFYDSSWTNWENGEFDLVPYTGSANAMGKFNETATAGIFWDIHDQLDDDYSGNIDWGDTTRPHHPDDIWDTLWNGIDSILIVLLERDVNGHHPDNIDEFWQAWFSTSWPGHGQAMMDIWYEHGEIMPCCNTDNMRGNVNGEGGINTADLTYLVDFLFFSGSPPPCIEEADVNGDASVNVADLPYLVDYLFFSGPAPAPCP